jgi:glycosyltransferase involved in cell wall biosynthesis
MAAASVSLVIPSYNEERRLPRLASALRDSAPRDLADADLTLVETIVVDDGSLDSSADVLQQEQAMTPGLAPLIRQGRNEGKGAAVAAGVAIATGELVLISDVDLAAPLAEAGELLAAIEDGADGAIGSRAIDPGLVSGIPLRRRVMGRAFNGLVRTMSGLPYRDTQCGFKLFPTPVARRLLAEQITPRFAFDVEILMRARRAGLRVDEVPIEYHHDPDSSIAPGRASAQMAWDVARLAFRLRGRAAN